MIKGGTLQLDGVLQQQHAVTGTRDLGKQRIGQSGLTATGTSGDKDVLAFVHCAAQVIGLRSSKDSVPYIALKRDDTS